MYAHRVHTLTHLLFSFVLFLSSLTPQEIITEKLIEGYTLQGGACEACVAPLMTWKGDTLCVVCETARAKTKDSNKKGKGGKKITKFDLEKSKKDTDVALSMNLRAGEDKESLVNRVTSAYGEM